jgi:hypothetical protein
VEIGVFVDLDNNPDKVPGDNADNVAIYKSSGYWSPYNYYGPVNGQLGLNYSRDALSIGLTFNTLDDDRINGDVNYDGGNYKLQASANLQKLIENGYKNIGRLWGYYKLLDELVHLEIAYNSRDTQFWVSNTTGAFGGAGGIGSPILDVVSRIGPGSNAWDAYADPWGGDRETFTKVDHGNYLLADVQLSGISFGVMLRSLFLDSYIFNSADNTGNWVSGYTRVRDTEFPKAVGNNGSGWKFVDEVMMKTTFGVKLDMQPVEVAAQFRLGDYGAYLGGTWSIGAVTVGMSFMGILQVNDWDGEKIDGANKIKVGGDISFNPDAFGVTLKGWYGVNKLASDTRATQIAIEPGFFYNVIPTHLQFATDFGFYFNGGKLGGDKIDTEVTWAVQPQIFGNFLGTGAGTYYSFGTGMIARYRLVSDAVNALDVSFKFSF